jgi:CarboxypepD_reg-like domain
MQRILAFGILWLCLASVASAQPVQLSGKVVDTDTQDPLPYASISVEGTGIGVVANTEGT